MARAHVVVAVYGAKVPYIFFVKMCIYVPCYQFSSVICTRTMCEKVSNYNYFNCDISYKKDQDIEQKLNKFSKYLEQFSKYLGQLKRCCSRRNTDEILW